MHFHSFGEFATRYGLDDFGSANGLTAALGLIDERKAEFVIPSYFIIVTCFHLDHAHTILSVTTKNTTGGTQPSRSNGICHIKWRPGWGEQVGRHAQQANRQAGRRACSQAGRQSGGAHINERTGRERSDGRAGGPRRSKQANAPEKPSGSDGIWHEASGGQASR